MTGLTMTRSPRGHPSRPRRTDWQGINSYASKSPTKQRSGHQDLRPGPAGATRRVGTSHCFTKQSGVGLSEGT